MDVTFRSRTFASEPTSLTEEQILAAQFSAFAFCPQWLAFLITLCLKKKMNRLKTARTSGVRFWLATAESALELHVPLVVFKHPYKTRDNSIFLPCAHYLLVSKLSPKVTLA